MMNVARDHKCIAKIGRALLELAEVHIVSLSSSTIAQSCPSVIA
jgi:hypothetical protein